MSGTIAKLALHSTSNNANAYTIPASGSFTPTAGKVLVVFGIIGGTVDTAPTCSGSANSLTFSKISSDPHALAGFLTVLFVSSVVPSSPAAMTVTVNCPTDAGTSALLWVAEVDGILAGGASAVRSVSGTPQFGKSIDIAANGSWGVSLPAAPLSTNPILGFLGSVGTNQATGSGVSPPTGFTEVEEPVDQSAAVIGAEFCKAESGIGSAGPHSWTASVGRTRANIYIVEFDTTSGGGPTLDKTDFFLVL